MKKIKLYLVALFMLPICVSAQSYNYNDTLPLSSSVRFGVLTNGLKYYILKNGKPSKVIEMQLAVNAGYADEDPDQLGLSHFLEHIGVRSTINFPDGIGNFFRERGVSVSASTSNLTRYAISIPATNEMIDAGFKALRDWANCNSFLFYTKDVEDERSAVLREGEPNFNRVFHSLAEVEYFLLDKHPEHKPNYLEHRKSVEIASIAPIKRFYKDWYHPKYESIFIVGDVDVDSMESRVLKSFNDLTNEGAREKRAVKNIYDVPLPGSNKLLTLAQPGKGINIVIYRKQKRLSDGIYTKNDLKDYLMNDLFTEMMRNRLKNKFEDKISGSFNTQFSLHRFDSRARLEAIQATATVEKVSEIKPCIQFMATEIQRVKLFGFSDSELQDAKKELLNQVAFNMKPSSRDLITRLTSHDSGQPYFDNESFIRAEIVKEVSLNDLNSKYMNWFDTNDNKDVLITSSDLKTQKYPNDKEVFAWIEQARKTKITRFKIPVPPVVKSLPQPIKETTYPEPEVKELNGLGASTVVLRNGATVILKPLIIDTGVIMSNPESDLVTLRCFKKASTDELYDVPNLYNCFKNANSFVSLKSLSTKDISIWVQEKIKQNGDLFVTLTTGSGGVEIYGAATSKNVQSMVNLVYAYFTEMKLDHAAFTKYYQSQAVTATISDPIQYYENEFLKKPQAQTHNKNDLLKIDETFKIYKSNFSSVADFVFVITGPFDQKEMIELVTKYLGSLPNVPKDYTTLSKKPSPDMSRDSSEAVNLTLGADSSGNVNVELLFKAKCEVNLVNQVLFNVLNNSLDALLFNRLREKEKGVYTPSSQLREGNYNNFVIRVGFSTSPHDVSRLVDATVDELNRIKMGELQKDIFSGAVERTRIKITRDLNDSYFWNVYLTKQAGKGDISKIENPATQIDILNQLTPADIINAVRKYVNTSDYMLFKFL